MTLFVQAGSGGIGDRHRRRHANAEALQNGRHSSTRRRLGSANERSL